MDRDEDSARMDYRLRVRHEPGHTRLTITGRPSFDELLALFNVIGVQSEGWPGDSLLLDLRGVTSRYPPEEEYRVGEEIVLSLAHLRRIASVVPTDRITRLSERAARRNRVDLRVFDDEAQALAWLLAP